MRVVEIFINFETMRLFLTVLFICSMVAAQAQIVNDAGKVRFMSYNIRVGKGMDLNQDLERIASVINRENPFIAALQEIDSVTSRTGGVNQIEELGRMTSMFATFAGAIDYSGGRYGVGMLSKEKPLSIKKVALPGREESRILLIVEFRNFVAATTHFSLTEEDRVEGAKILNREAMLFNKPMLVGGDFNAQPQSKTIQIINTVFTTLSNNSIATFPANSPEICIDYIFGKNLKNFTYKVLYNSVVPESIASDHRPVVVDVIIK